MKFLYFEPCNYAHSAFFYRRFVEAAREAPRIDSLVSVISRQLGETLGPAAASGPGHHRVVLGERDFEACNTGSLASRGLAQWGVARRLLNAHQAACCFIPAFDQAVLGAVLDRRPVAGIISGIIFRSPNYFGATLNISSRLDKWRRLVTYRLSTRPATPVLMTLDPYFLAHAASSERARFRLVPDPAPDLCLIQRGTTPPSAPRGRIAFLLFGSLCRRKGVLSLLQSLRHLSPDVRDRTEIRLVGRIVDDERSEVLAAIDAARACAPGVHLLVDDRFVSDSELAVAVASSDVVLLPYQGHVGSSGSLYWAAAAGKPVIAQNSGLIAWQVVTFGLGSTVDTGNPQRLADAIGNPPAPPSDPAPFLANHAGEDFFRAILDSVAGHPGARRRG